MLRRLKLEVTMWTARVFGIRIRRGPLTGLRLFGNLFYNRRSHELNEEEILYMSLPLQGCTVIEVGAHIGIYTLLLSRKVGQAGHIVAVEPNPSSYQLLKKNIGVNRPSNVSTFQCGISNESGTLIMVSKRHNTATASFREDKHAQILRSGQSVRQCSVRVDTLDQLVANKKLSRVDFVKIDTEGFEWNVMEGMSVVMARFHPAIFFELHGNVEQKITDFLRISDLLRSQGYRLTLLASGAPQPTEKLIRQRGGGACMAYQEGSPIHACLKQIYST